MVTNPIWKDTYYVTTADTLDYRILLEGDEIYAGKAVKYPDADLLRININKVCSNYLESDFALELEDMPLAVTNYTHLNEQRTFELYSGDTKLEDYVFYQDYSYTDDKPTGGTNIYVSNPINGHFVPGMLKVSTARHSSSGYVSTVSATPTPGQGYTKQVKCTPYVLYYLNSYGGWDAFVIEGNTTKRDAYTTYTTDQSFNNTTLEFEYNKYVQEIKTTYVMNTGLLTDEQSKNLAKNLIGSLKVYLQNIDEGWVKPVVITDSSVDYQSYSINGRKLSQYKITVQESQTKVRK